MLIICSINGYLPSRGTASEVAGIVSATILRKTVRDNRIVTPMRLQWNERRKEEKRNDRNLNENN
jgi:hypothetical protein